MADPFISVIIVAHNRRQYLRRAITSVANQTLDKKLYEIIVVKNFKDRGIDGYIRRIGAKSILTGNHPLGHDYATGIGASRGGVIAFLEDDDYFYGRKLARVYEVFSGNPNVCYYHNACVYVNEDGRVLGEPYKRIDRPVIISSKAGDPTNVFLGVMGCVAMRSSLARKYAKVLRGFNLADSLLFFGALASRKLLYLDSETLTYNTTHRGSFTNPVYGDYEEFRKKNIPISEAILNNYSRIAKIVGEPKPWRYKYVRLEITYHKAVLNILNGREVYKLKSCDYLNLLVDWSIPVLLASALRGISPRAAGYVYYRSSIAKRNRFLAER